ncbi:MAG TPA: GTPase [Candidatus Thermoplasmatota archaeon]|nr:GTPase [Candidatus Thermoplasmatota archaeon]
MDLDFRRIPTIMDADEILDRAFRRAARVTIMARDPMERFKATESARVRTVQNLVDATLDRYVRKYPNFDELSPFYGELAGVLIDLDKTRKSLGALGWARKQTVKLGDEAVAKIKAARREDTVLNAKKAVYGRISSVVKQVDSDLRWLNGARDELKRLPTIDPEVPTIVVAGYPNVGKSSLVRKVSSGEPEVAPYPFTTKGITIGHFEKRRIRYQIVDTPGILDRKMEERNAIERQAVLALKHLSDVIVFMLDPSERCGYTIEEQERLLKEVSGMFPEATIIVAENKVDVGEGKYTKAKDRHRTSTETGEGLDELMAAAIKVASKKASLPSRR